MRSVVRSKSYIGYLSRKRVAVLGYGSQGRAQALNLRDSGVIPLIGLPPRSRARRAARSDRFEVADVREAIRRSEVVAVLIPDQKHQELFEGLPKGIFDGKAVIFAHGFSVAFGLVKIPGNCDVILVAPHGPGLRLRELFLNDQDFTAFWAIEKNHSGNARRIGRAYASAIGCRPSNLFTSTFRDEAIGDVFGEQAVLCGGLVGLMEAGFNTLVRHGFSPETAYLECIHQIDLIVDLVKQHGPAGMLGKISVTAAFGSLESRRKIFGRRQEFEALYRDVANGAFARRLTKENRQGMRSFRRILDEFRGSLLQRTHHSLIKKLRH